MENKTIQVTVQGGVVVDVKNLPEGWDLQIIDKDNVERMEQHIYQNQKANDD
mgnify:CR=1 FL=1